MKLLNPINITLTTTNVPETDYPEWAVGTTYALGDRVIVLSEHNVYESLASSNIGNTPSTTPDKWALVGKTNAYKCIDDKVSTQTINSTSIIMTFPTLKSTSISFLNVECESIILLRTIKGFYPDRSKKNKTITCRCSPFKFAAIRCCGPKLFQNHSHRRERKAPCCQFIHITSI